LPWAGAEAQDADESSIFEEVAAVVQECAEQAAAAAEGDADYADAKMKAWLELTEEDEGVRTLDEALGVGGEPSEAPIRLVDARFLVALAKAEGGRLVGRDALPEGAFFDVSRLQRESYGSLENTLRVLAVSMPRLSGEHPDPAGVLLRRLGRVLDSFVEDYGGSYGVLLPYCSVSPPADDGERYERALHGLASIYGHTAIPVLLLPALPADVDASGAASAAYAVLGWSLFESCVARLVKPPTMVIDVSKFEDEGGEEAPFLEPLVESCRALNTPPLLPAAFAAALRARAFVRDADREVLAAAYEAFFNAAFPSLDALLYDGNGWGDDEVRALCAVLSQTDMPKCRQLWLSKNHLTDEGMKIIEQCLRGGALPSLESVHVYGMPNASFKSRDEIRNAREDLKVCYDGMGGGRDNHIQ
jgi:hypothetical protein